MNANRRCAGSCAPRCDLCEIVTWANETARWIETRWIEAKALEEVKP